MVNWSSSPDVRNTIFSDNKDDSGTGTITATTYLTHNSTISLSHGLVQGLDSSGNGAVTNSPAGIDCGITCTVTRVEGRIIFLTPPPKMAPASPVGAARAAPVPGFAS